MANQAEDAKDGTSKDVDRFRQILSSVPSGVSVVTALDDGEPVGITMASLIMVSTEPLLVGFLPGVSSKTFTRIRQSGAFCVNILTQGQENVSNTFARPGTDKFANLPWRPAPKTGSPLLDGAAAWIDCRLTTVYEPGNHFIALGEALAFDASDEELPLVFHRGRYAGLKTDK
ncbi:flavin reductase family protein [Streptomyces bobili]|uniref:flavin reductase family protein n=1 Tax=Streptomyces bobili TaxID=67280 RepID=UPI00364DE297